MAQLPDDAGEFELFQALRLLENGAVGGVRGQPVGVDHGPREEIARLRGSPSLGFPVDAIETMELRRSPVAGQGRRAEVTVAGLGAFGATGPLPYHYTEYVFERMSQRDRSLRDFVDVLQHRSLAFFYRAWRKYRLPFAWEAEQRDGRFDDFTAMLSALVGLDPKELARVPEGGQRWLFFTGLFASRHRTAAGLEAMVAAATGCAAEVREFVGRWQTLLPDERSRLGGRGRDEYRNALGSSLVLGERVLDVLSSVRIRIGPMPARRLGEFSVGDSRRGWIAALIRSYLGSDRDFELVGAVAAATVEPVRLGGGGHGGLGSAAWMSSRHASGYTQEVTLCRS
jgi:type VI secretion system protein ImpH